jgi:hypothetical protein
MTPEPTWCILRTKPSSTLKLAASLAVDGFDVWTPVETFTKKVPRANVKRTVQRPMMAGFVFAKFGHLFDLLELAKMPVKPRRGAGLRNPAHADFWFFRHAGKLGFTSEAGLAGVRAEEAKLIPPPPRIAVPKGRYMPADRSLDGGVGVRVTDGPAEGMAGTVASGDRHYTVVCFASGREMKIPTSLLTEDEAYQLQSATDTAALAA